VSRSNLDQRIYGRYIDRSTSHNKLDDELLLPLIEELSDGQAIKDYLRITAHLNRKLHSDDYSFARVSRKFVYRIMRLNKWLLPEHGNIAPMMARLGAALQYALPFRGLSN